ncbi:large-conductance mechanosensitive channel [Fructobacillus fructosus]|uniref:MscL family protein n=1 Tax=Fructobacillus fructosus TaxID=1631 RepID=UPI000219572B|nr:MscL family protein [Fructobacillus fructosus]KRN52404.1 large-conductance mechanosensitive channel [Fructobacillus fructosus KCTC 3544]GAP01984.1 large-conductance mechanosensitive channel [Fructobacillus fructosus]
MPKTITETLKESTTKFQSNGSAKISAFRRFIFAPNLLTFVISVVVGNSFGSAIKDLIATASGLIKILTVWLFTSGHKLNLDYALTPLASLLDSLLTLLFIAIVVFYTIQFINNYLVRNNDEKWGYDQAHVDAIKIQKLQNKNNQLVEENIKLQHELLEEFRKNK